MKIALAGATGLVGSRTLSRLLADGHDLVSVGRRPSGAHHPRLSERVVDFANLPPLPPIDAAVCALGTTMAVAGSKAAFRAVDHDAVLAFAAAAQNAGARHLILVTAIGAHPEAAAFYSRVKGEVEAAVGKLGFARIDIIRPGVIIGPRTDRRPVESVLQWLAPKLDSVLPASFARFGSIPAETIADAIAALVFQQGTGARAHTNAELRRLALACA